MSCFPVAWDRAVSCGFVKLLLMFFFIFKSAAECVLLAATVGTIGELLTKWLTKQHWPIDLDQFLDTQIGLLQLTSHSEALAFSVFEIYQLQRYEAACSLARNTHMAHAAAFPIRTHRNSSSSASSLVLVKRRSKQTALSTTVLIKVLWGRT